jgi:hypothetical protein
MRYTTVLLAGTLLCVPAMFGTTIFTTTGTLTNLDPIQAQASFTFGNGTIQLVLTNLIVNQNDVGQDLNGITFTIPGSFATNGGLIGSFSATDRSDIAANVANGWTDAADSANHWFLTNSSGNFKFTTIGNPAGAYTIVGSPEPNNKYHTNASIDNHDPLLAITATWNFNVPGVTAATEANISNVSFSFGTAFDEGGGQPGDPCSRVCVEANSSVPEPLSLGLSGVGLVLIGLRRKFGR